MPSAEPIFEDKQVLEDGAIIEMRIWRVPAAVPPSPHEFKYTLFYGRPDNERGKGDHRHIGPVETGYRCASPERLIEDFTAALQAARKEAR